MVHWQSIPELKRQFHYLRYNLKPFRFRLILTHTLKRLSSALGKQRGFRIIDLAITYRCNQFCQHCSAHPLIQDAPTLTLEEYRRIAAEAETLDLLSWNITGGEALLVDWLEDLIPILKPEIHYISVQSNCMALSEKRARRLAKLGVNCITTSLDSVHPEEHDTFRGVAGAYQKTLEGISNARRAGMQVLVGGTVTHQNIRSQDLRRLIEKANDEGAIFLYNLAVPCGKWTTNSDVILRGHDREYLRQLLARYPKSSTDHEVGRNAIGCPAGMEKMYITPYGDVIPCPFIHVRFGNVKEASLPEIVKRMRSVSFFSQYQKVCIAAEDTQFHTQVLQRVAQQEGGCPVWYKNIFGEQENG